MTEPGANGGGRDRSARLVTPGPPDPPPGPGEPRADLLTERLPRAVLLAFAAWTLLCHLVVLLGGGLRMLLLAALLVVAVTGARWWTRRRVRSEGTVPDPAAASTSPPPTTSPQRGVPGTPGAVLLRMAGAAVLAGAALSLYKLSGDFRLYWWVACPTLLLVYVEALRQPASVPRPEVPSTRAGRSVRGWLLVALSGACALLTLVAHRPNADDALYANLAAQAADHPGAPLLSADGLFGIPDAPIQRPVYRVHSLELLVGAISWLTGAPPLLLLHWGVAVGAAFLLPLVHARLMRLLLPDAWLLATFFSVCLLWLWGGSDSAYGNFAFVRLWQGKAILASLLVPWLLAETLVHVSRPGRGNLIGLVAAVVGSVGLTATGLIVAPVVLVVGLAAVWRPDRWATRRALAGLLGLLHPLVWVLILGGGLAGGLETEPGGPASSLAVESSLARIVGSGPARGLALFGLLFAWSAVRSVAGRRLATLLPLVFLLIVVSPHWSADLAAELSEPVLFERLYWILPLSVVLGLTLAAPALGLRRWTRPRVATSAALLIGGGVLIAIPTVSTLSSENGTRLSWPGPKVPQSAYQAARLLVESSPPGSHVLAPEPVATWLTVFRDHPHPLYSRQIYDFQLRSALGVADANRRRSLAFGADAHASLDPERLRTAVEDYGLTAVCCRVGARARRPSMLTDLGFEKAGEHGEFEVWVRMEAPMGVGTESPVAGEPEID